MLLESLMPGGLDREGEEANGAWQREYEEEPPTAIDPRRHMHYVEVSEDGLVATFVGRGEYTDVGVRENALTGGFPHPCNIQLCCVIAKAVFPCLHCERQRRLN